MEDATMQRLMKVLTFRQRPDLSDLFVDSVSYMAENVGDLASSQVSLSTFYIKSPPTAQAKIARLSEKDREEILQALRVVYPLKSSQPEITSIIFDLI